MPLGNVQIVPLCAVGIQGHHCVVSASYVEVTCRPERAFLHGYQLQNEVVVGLLSSGVVRGASVILKAG